MIVDLDRNGYTVTARGDDLRDLDLDTDYGTQLPGELKRGLIQSMDAIVGDGFLSYELVIRIELPNGDDTTEMTARVTGFPGAVSGVTGTKMTHLFVAESGRESGVGTFLFDVYRVFAIYVGGYARGIIGGTDATENFLLRQGIPRDEITQTTNALGSTLYGQSWKVPASTLREEPGENLRIFPD